MNNLEFINTEHDYRKYGMRRCITLWPAVSFQEYNDGRRHLAIYWLAYCLFITLPAGPTCEQRVKKWSAHALRMKERLDALGKTFKVVVELQEDEPSDPNSATCPQCEAREDDAWVETMHDLAQPCCDERREETINRMIKEAP